MPPIRLWNSMSRTKEAFAPLDPANVRMYVCGPTVYDRAHLGNARPVVVFDVLFRLLRHVYGAEHVTYVRNFTDVDDKINARAAEMRAAGDARPLEAIIHALTDETIAWYHADMDALGALRPGDEPRATHYIAQMIAMIDDLIARGHAYEVEGHVLFSVDSWREGYGHLSGRSVEDMIAGARVEVAPYKRNPMDFVLWKPSDAGLPGWPSPWGRGRPGWHIECSAMSHELLGEDFDIHGGGLDLQFPHHENEIAQSRCAHPGSHFARFWLHNEMVMVDGRKMSKSLGNFFTVRDLLDQGIPGEVIRYVFLMTHYRKPMDWTGEKVREALQHTSAWFNLLHAQGYGASLVKMLKEAGRWSPDEVVLDALSNDLNTPAAIARLHAMPKPDSAVGLAPFAASLELLGLVPDWDLLRLAAGAGFSTVGERDPTDSLIASLLFQRDNARRARDYALADRIRDRLARAGVEIRDNPGGASSFERTARFSARLLEEEGS